MFSTAVERLQVLQREGSADAAQCRSLLQECLYLDEGPDLPERQWEVQRQLFAALFRDPLLRFAPLPKVRKCVSRAILDALEAGRVEEVDDELYEACAAQVAQEDVSSSWGYKLIDVLGQGHLALRVATQIGGGLETGCIPWTGGCVFLGLALTGCLSTDLNGPLLELGAGTGILGLGLALTGSMVTLTDAQPAVLENLRHNLEATRACAAKASGDFRADVQALDWSRPDLSALGAAKVVIGSDLAYDEDALPALAALLKALLEPQGSAMHALLACMQRKETTIAALEAALASHGLSWCTPELPEAAWLSAKDWARHGCDAASCGAERVCLLKIQDSSRLPGASPSDGEKHERLRLLPKGPCRVHFYNQWLMRATWFWIGAFYFGSACLQRSYYPILDKDGQEPHDIWDLLSITMLLFSVNLFAVGRKYYIEKGQRTKFIYDGRQREATQRIFRILEVMVPVHVIVPMLRGSVIAEKVDRASILFVMFVDFDQTARKKEPEALLAYLNHYFTKFDDICSAHEVTKIETVGEEYVSAVGVIPRDIEADKAMGHAVILGRLIKAAKEILMVQRDTQGSDEEVKLKMGIHTGPVVAGVIGQKLPRFRLFGDTINTAARLMQKGLPGELQFGEATKSCLPRGVAYRWRDNIEMKGKGKVPTWLLGSSEASPASGPQPSPAPPSPAPPKPKEAAETRRRVSFAEDCRSSVSSSERPSLTKLCSDTAEVTKTTENSDSDSASAHLAKKLSLRSRENGDSRRKRHTARSPSDQEEAIELTAVARSPSGTSRPSILRRSSRSSTADDGSASSHSLLGSQDLHNTVIEQIHTSTAVEAYCEQVCRRSFFCIRCPGFFRAGIVMSGRSRSPNARAWGTSIHVEIEESSLQEQAQRVKTLLPEDVQNRLRGLVQEGLVKEGDLDIQAAGSDMLRVRVRARPSGECLMESVIVHSHHHQQQQQHQQHHQHHHQAPHFLLCHHRDLIVTVSVLSMVALLIRNQLAKQ
eukprot:s345_g2.t1